MTRARETLYEMIIVDDDGRDDTEAAVSRATVTGSQTLDLRSAGTASD